MCIYVYMYMCTSTQARACVCMHVCTYRVHVNKRQVENISLNGKIGDSIECVSNNSGNERTRYKLIIWKINFKGLFIYGECETNIVYNVALHYQR